MFATTIIILFSLILFGSVITTIFKGGEKDGLCKYGYKDNDQNEQ